jgi:site-specific DNA-methyltransferase (adenine-specific)
MIDFANLPAKDKIYYQDDSTVIYCADNREILPLFPDKAFDFAWCDPPYNVGKKYNTWNDLMPDGDYLKFCSDWFTQLVRTSSEQAVYVPTKYIYEYWQMFGPEAKQIILNWTPEGAYRGGFVNQFATVLTNAKPKQRTKDVWTNYQMQGLGYFFRENSYGNPGYTSEDITTHLLTSFTTSKQYIIDCFLGTGTTAVCSKRLGRYCIGIEVDELSCEIAAKRLSQSVMQLEIPKEDVKTENLI